MSYVVPVCNICATSVHSPFTSTRWSAVHQNLLPSASSTSYNSSGTNALVQCTTAVSRVCVFSLNAVRKSPRRMSAIGLYLPFNKSILLSAVRHCTCRLRKSYRSSAPHVLLGIRCPVCWLLPTSPRAPQDVQTSPSRFRTTCFTSSQSLSLLRCKGVFFVLRGICRFVIELVSWGLVCPLRAISRPSLLLIIV